MTTTIIITFCGLLLVAYVFDLSSKRTRIPAVILLLLLGWVARQLTYFFHIKLPDFSSILPVLGTVGLILIVLEGSLELKLNKSKLPLLGKSFFGALVPMLSMAFLLAYLLQYFMPSDFKADLSNVIPLSVISSSIAISSVKNLATTDKEFVIYESSFSDILGVLFFNFIALNQFISGKSFATFGLQILEITFISLVAIILLSLLLSKIDHDIKFVPIILLVILIYTIAHEYDLPALIFILLFGLFLGNLDELKKFRWFRKVQPEELDKEMQKFKELTVEAAFMLRSLFFLLFGYMIETKDIVKVETLSWTFGIVGIIFISRVVQLLISRLPLIPLLFIAPRGLVTILLFLSIAPAKQIPLINKSLIIQVIIITSLIMMIGLILTKKDAETEKKELEENTEMPVEIPV
jgi:Kef-type K+ transport system membrane component KefB